MTLYVPDTSQFQPGASEEGIRRANGGASIIRAGYGQSLRDEVFETKRAAAHAAHMRFLGLYHYLTADVPAQAQAESFCRWVRHLSPAEIPIADIEEGAGDQRPRFEAWASTVEHVLGKRPWLYSGAFFAVEHGLAPLFFGSEYHTWVAAYGSVEPALGHTLWQCTDGRIGSSIRTWPGAGLCDTSRYRGTIGDLAALASGRVRPKPVKPPEGTMTITTDGKLTLAEIAHAHAVSPMGILRRTAEAGKDHEFGSAVADWGNGVFAGTHRVDDPVPAGLHLTIRG